jgi:hypothetical protein
MYVSSISCSEIIRSDKLAFLLCENLPGYKSFLILLIMNSTPYTIYFLKFDLELPMPDIFSDKLFKEEAANLCCENPDSRRR